eukprot:TRINITY_DN13867_c0_g1_i1.p1 TRINITY_DN13867_c0_g1~~TRINITY_DN13867_c0_g1_i1.p1  ORF type:complete len:832 (-),score=153.56 TRINITY_DN13867_c0_g1_i1:703-3198(-)
MDSTMSLYSRSPPMFSGFAVHPSQPSPSCATSCSLEVVAPVVSASGPVRGGLSYLLSGSKGLASTSGNDCGDSFSGPASVGGRSIAQTDMFIMAGPKDSYECRSEPVSIASTSGMRMRERSPVSVLLGGSSARSSFSSPISSLITWEGNATVPTFDSNMVPTGRKRGSSVTRNDVKAPFLTTVGFRLGGDGDVAALQLIAPQVDVNTAKLRPRELAQGDVAYDTCFFKPHAEEGQADVRSNMAMFAQSSGGLPSASGLYSGASHSQRVLDDDPWLHSMDRTAVQLYMDALSRHEILKNPVVKKAFSIAARAYHGQIRRTGASCLTHCVETALALAATSPDAVIVAAGLLHDTLDETAVSERELRADIGDEVADLVVGVSKMSAFSQLVRDNWTSYSPVEADRLRTMSLSMVDVRVVLIKLAERLHTMRVLDALPANKQQRIASETMEIFAPLANRLGIWRWKAELEDLCFKHLLPDEFKTLTALVAEGHGEEVMMQCLRKIATALEDNGVAFEDLCGRPKNLYSIYRKMKNKSRSIDQIYDVRGLRLIVKDEASCYAALDAVRGLWKCIPGKFKDYIKSPKENGYQSLHVIVIGEDGHPLEVQIRTLDMHHSAEFGLAAHWRYKEGDQDAAGSSSYVDKRVEWARWVLTWHSEMMDTKIRLSPSEADLRPPCPFPVHKEDCPHAMCCSMPPPPESSDTPVMVLLMEGETMVVQEFPAGSTASTVIEDRKAKELVGFKRPAFRALVNSELVEDLNQRLCMGDFMELMRCEDDFDGILLDEDLEGRLPPLLPLHVAEEGMVASGKQMAVDRERQRLVSMFSMDSRKLEMNPLR